MAAVRRSCQPIPGPTGSPVVRSHTTVDARWLAMPTDTTGPPAAKAAPATSNAAAAIVDASNSTKPWLGVVGSTWRWWTWETVASAPTMAARTPLVPTSTTRWFTRSSDGLAGAAGLVDREASSAPKMPVEQDMKAWNTRLKGSGPLLPATARAAITTTTSTANDVSDASAPWTSGRVEAVAAGVEPGPHLSPEEDEVEEDDDIGVPGHGRAQDDGGHGHGHGQGRRPDDDLPVDAELDVSRGHPAFRCRRSSPRRPAWARSSSRADR